jgi:hypothetical protein
MTSFYELSQEERDDMGSAGRKHVLDNYSMAKYSGLWYQTFQEVFEDMGSWETRKNYKSWELFEV